ncbi:hypothetical protein PTH_2424 [Pelotomaculum thermopropionicum SI]|uniref:Uncharacterized protein n=1 Tax=Pelotomaculum thermopropionicum (strain DSM 13744 / JCM 10971 / SI) TaxID=370438 RepID=A5CZH1_PELTS|nr:hypothetical protein PTH_2424 [Pelotomaculum thermopropionicum SI]
MLICILATERNVFHIIKKFFMLPFLNNNKFSVFSLDFQTTSSKSPCENNLFRALTDIYKTPTTGNFWTKLGDIHVTISIGLGQAKICHI